MNEFNFKFDIHNLKKRFTKIYKLMEKKIMKSEKFKWIGGERN